MHVVRLQELQLGHVDSPTVLLRKPERHCELDLPKDFQVQLVVLGDRTEESRGNLQLLGDCPPWNRDQLLLDTVQDGASDKLFHGLRVLDYTDERQAPIMYRTDKMFDPSQDGSWYTDRYGAAIFAGGWSKRRQTRVGFQFYENYCEADPVLCDSDRTPDQNNRMYQSEELLAKFREELKEMHVKNVEVIRQFPWPYFHHFPNEAIMEGAPWSLFEMQGARKTWWIGASACFESVCDVTNYNLSFSRPTWVLR